MLRNKIPLCAFVGFIAIVFGLFFMVIGLIITNSIGMRTDPYNLLLCFLPLIGGGTLLFAGIGLWRRKNWGRIVVNIFLFFCFAGLALMIFLFVMEMSRRSFQKHMAAQICVVIFSTSIVMGILLFLNNTRVMDELAGKEQEKETEL